MIIIAYTAIPFPAGSRRQGAQLQMLFFAWKSAALRRPTICNIIAPYRLFLRRCIERVDGEAMRQPFGFWYAVHRFPLWTVLVLY